MQISWKSCCADLRWTSRFGELDPVMEDRLFPPFSGPPPGTRLVSSLDICTVNRRAPLATSVNLASPNDAALCMKV
ncbi:unnamed protein product [Protopolystoma xenopodis]|uniref:Uncharacterized protein n=1 Tax=Protopolystoma xenopodis TaxID=117903 RepID=A0A448XNF4_9PLAT|nr:unnamed protein product [Protopolystoma xenopodis]